MPVPGRPYSKTPVGHGGISLLPLKSPHICIGNTTLSFTSVNSSSSPPILSKFVSISSGDSTSAAMRAS